MSYLSEFSVVFHENCTIGKLTLSSIQPHRATSSIRPSLLMSVLSKVSSNILRFASPHFCHISVSFQLFFMKIAPLESSRYPLFNRIEQRPSLLTRVLSKVSSNILQFASPHLCHISVSFQLFFAKIAPLESSRYPLFIRIKRRYPLGRLHWRECSKNSHPISSNCAPPISVISQWVFSCFSWKFHHWKAHVILYSTA